MDVKIGKGLTMAVDLSKFDLVESGLSPVAKHLFYIGARNVLMDSHANATIKANPNNYVALSKGLAEKKLVRLYAGELRTEREQSVMSSLAAMMHESARDRGFKNLKDWETTAPDTFEKSEVYFAKIIEAAMAGIPDND